MSRLGFLRGRTSADLKATGAILEDRDELKMFTNEGEEFEEEQE